MTQNRPTDNETTTGDRAALPPEVVVTSPMPRLGRGIRWSDVLAEIERDERERAVTRAYRDAA
ncbi:DUF6222 family protein [Amycolatopsis sp. NPDC098790]|uniref:DUF6222 family protein n=1 Tax=Amycolatopsis sp. NPDC098790 TaxID=3363939 RepID=UPI003815CCFF